MNTKTSYELFGIECGPGWKCLIDPLIRRCRREGVEIHQVKEKFGGLRFYTGPASDSLLAAIDDAEDLSFYVCESCGAPGYPTTTGYGWILTLCDTCEAIKE